MTKYALLGILMFETMGYGQVRDRASNLKTIHVNPAVQRAAEDYTTKRKIVIQAQQKLDTLLLHADGAKTDPVIAEAEKKVESAAVDAKEAASKVLAEPVLSPVPADNVKALKDEVNLLKAQAAKDASRSNTTLLSLTIGSILLALSASVTGFLKKAVIAGVLSTLAAGAGGIPKALALDQQSDYNQMLSRQASILALDIQFDLLISVDDYNGYVSQLRILTLGSEPEATKSREAAEALVAELQSAKPPHRD